MGSQSTITGFTSGSMRRDDKDRKPGTPIYLGERPADRPLADKLGSGKAASVHQAAVDGRETVRRRQQATDYFRNLCGIKLFSWEQGST